MTEREEDSDPRPLSRVQYGREGVVLSLRTPPRRVYEGCVPFSPRVTYLTPEAEKLMTGSGRCLFPTLPYIRTYTRR